MQLEADILDHGAPAEALHREHHLADLGLLLREQVRQLAAHHQFDELVAVEFLRRVGTDVLAVAEDGDVVGDPEDLVHLVGDVDDGDPEVGQALDHPVQVRHLAFRNGRGGFVHDDDLRVVADGLGNLDHLLFRHRQVLHPGPRVDVDLPLVEEFTGLAEHGGGAEQPQTAARLAAQPDVLRHHHLGDGGQLLVDHRDAVLQAVLGVLEVHLLTGQLHRAGVRLVHADQAFHQRGLARAVLSHQGVHRAAADVQVDLVKRHDSREGLADVAHPQNYLLHWFSCERDSGVAPGRSILIDSGIRPCSRA